MLKIDKPELVKYFLGGRSVQQTADMFSVNRGQIEKCLREAISGMAQLNTLLSSRVLLRRFSMDAGDFVYRMFPPEEAAALVFSKDWERVPLQVTEPQPDNQVIV